MATIELGGKAHKLRFDASATAEIQRLYGDILEALNEKTKIYADAIKLATVLINQNIAYNNYMNSTRDALYTEEEIGMLILPADILSGTVRKAVIDSFNEAWPVSPGEKKTI